MINELILQLVQKAGLSEEQATKAAQVAHEFIKSKLPPQMASTVDSFFNNGGPGAAEASSAAGNNTGEQGQKAKDKVHEAAEKMADFASQARDKAGDFAEDAGKKIGEWAEKAEDIAEDALGKLKDLFGSRKDDRSSPK